MLGDETYGGGTEQGRQDQRPPIPARVPAQQVRPCRDRLGGRPDAPSECSADRLGGRGPVDRDRRGVLHQDPGRRRCRGHQGRSRPRATHCEAGPPRALTWPTATTARCSSTWRRSKRSVVVDPDEMRDMDGLAEMLGRADAVIWSPGSRVADLARRWLRPGPASRPSASDGDCHHPLRTGGSVERPGRHRVHVAGLVGRRRSGSVVAIRIGRRSFVGGQVGEWLAGAYAAVGTMVSRHRTATGCRRDRRRLDARGPGDVPHLLPGHVLRRHRHGHSDPSRSVVTPGVGDGQGRHVRRRRRHRASNGSTSASWSAIPSGWRTSRSSGSAATWPRSIDEWFGRPHRRRDPRSGHRLPAAELGDRQRRQSRRAGPLRGARLVRRATPAGASSSPGRPIGCSPRRFVRPSRLRTLGADTRMPGARWCRGDALWDDTAVLRLPLRGSAGAGHDRLLGRAVVHPHPRHAWAPT